MADKNALIALLKEKVETVVGRHIKTPKDFELLSQRLLDETTVQISATTLKRLWGYVNEDVSPRTSTLDTLSRFVGYDDWAAFVIANEHLIEPAEEPETDPSSSAKESEAKSEGTKVKKRSVFFAIAGVLLLIMATAVFYTRHVSKQVAELTDSLQVLSSDKYTILAGDTFATYDAYLNLFGVQADDRPWAQPLPGHSEICIWGPEFHNPHWHNDGDPDSLLPTITEYWNVEGADPETVHLRNADHFTYLRYRKELRITFMKGLRDSTFTFLGLYVMDRQQSDSTRIVWQRISKECDLTRLDFLEQLRR
ncbi:MAG: hypothetical protein K5893_03985 [Prevotella sp.]|nr:hypothetical protein [Prevotella sp.]